MSTTAEVFHKAELFDYLCWLETVSSPEELHCSDYLVFSSDGATHWGKTYGEAVRLSLEHDRDIYEVTKHVAHHHE